ncbi:MAG: type IV secretory system conjugative DNA transfer family protein, partial [Luteibacter sp.]
WVALAALLVAVWIAGLRLSGYVLLAWLGLADRVALGGDTYAQYWAARMLPEVAPYTWRIRLSGVAGFLLPLAAWGCILWWYVNRLAASRSTFPTRFATRVELRDAGMLDADEGVIVGARGAHALRWRGPGHVALCVPDEAVAEVQFVANVLDAPGSVIILDRENRLWRATSGHRATLGVVHLVRPFASDGRSHRWNPLARLSGNAGRRRQELSAVAAMLYDERRYGARPMRETKDAFTAFAGYVYDDVAARRALGATDGEASLTFGAIHQVVSRVSVEGKVAVKKMLGKPFIASDTRAALAALLRLTNSAFKARLASVEGPLPAFATAFAGKVMSGPDAVAPLQHGAVVSIYLSMDDDLTPGQRRVAAVLLWDLIRFGVERGSGTDRIAVLLNGIERVGPVQDLPDTLRETTRQGPRFVLRTGQPGRWREVYGTHDQAASMATMACRVVGAPSKRADENDFMDMFDFGNDAGNERPVRFDRSRAIQLRRDLAGLGPDQHLIVADELAGPVVATTASLLRDRRLASRLLPPVTVDPLDLGDPGMPSPTLRAIGATAALALAATACSQGNSPLSEQALAEHAKKDGPTSDQERLLRQTLGEREPNHRWEGYSEKLVPAKLGPHTFMFPMNLYEHQTGPDFQGKFQLVLRLPALAPFPPGAVNDRRYKAEYLDASVSIAPNYLANVAAVDWLDIITKRASYEDTDDPRADLSMRIRGERVFDLQPYYVDMEKLAAYMQRHGHSVERRQLLIASDDWFLAWDKAGALQTVIKCDPRELKGAGLVDGRIEDTPVGVDRGICHHTIVLPAYQVRIELTYLRAYLGSWRGIENRVREWFAHSIEK